MNPRTVLAFLAILVLLPLAIQAGEWPNQGHFAGDTGQPRKAVVVDIDGALTRYVLLNFGPTDGMFLDTGVDFARTDSVLLMNLYYRKGYDIVYVCGRPKNLEVKGVPMGDATLQWLDEMGYPTEPERTVLLIRDSPDSMIHSENRGQAMAEYVTQHGEALFSDMLSSLQKKTKVSYEYAYCDSDIAVNAFRSVGVPADHIFTIGNLGVSQLGYKGSQPILDPELNAGYGQHIRDYVIPKVPAANEAPSRASLPMKRSSNS